MNLEGGVAVITGTSRGIGHSLMESYIKRGNAVIGISRSKDIHIIESGENWVRIGFDWKDYDALSKLINSIIQPSGARIMTMVNNAGVLYKDAISESSYERFAEQMQVNVWNVLELFRSLHRAGLFGSGAHIVNIGSMGGVQGVAKYPGLFSYSASKAALVSLTESLAVEYGDEGLSFNYLALGAVNTEMLQEAFPGYISQVDPEKMAEFIMQFGEGSGKMMSGKVVQVAKSDPSA